MYLTEKLVLLIENQMDTPLLFPNILASDSVGAEEAIASTVGSGLAAEVAAGDPDVNAERAETVGEEAIGGTTPTPDQNVVDDIAEAAGVTFADKQPIQVEALLNQRDRQRWELDPDSAEDLSGRN